MTVAITGSEMGGSEWCAVVVAELALQERRGEGGGGAAAVQRRGRRVVVVGGDAGAAVPASRGAAHRGVDHVDRV